MMIAVASIDTAKPRPLFRPLSVPQVDVQGFWGARIDAVAGRTADILYERTEYRLPMALKVGDKVQILSTGAYTSSYASVGFNGFTPIKTYCI